MIDRVVYQYNTFNVGCGCCHDSSMEIEVYFADGNYVEYEVRELISNEQELRKFLSKFLPNLVNYHVDEYNCRWF